MAVYIHSNSPKMKELEKKILQYKKIVAELTLENVVMKDVIAKKL